MLILTNNPKVKEKMKAVNNSRIHYKDVSYGEILDFAKHLIVDKKMLLICHPLTGSIKPNETFFKTIFLSESSNLWIDMESLEYIESAITVYEKFMKNHTCPKWTEKVLEDFAFVDLYLTKSTLQRISSSYGYHSAEL